MSGVLEEGMWYGVAFWSKACGMEVGGRYVVWSSNFEQGIQYVVAPWSMAMEPSGSPIITLLMIYIIQGPLL